MWISRRPTRAAARRPARPPASRLWRTPRPGGGERPGPGIAHALAERRAAQIANMRYDLSLDLTGEARASGTIAIRFDRVRRQRRPGARLPGAGPSDLIVNDRPLSTQGRREGHLTLPQALLRTGANRITARFATPVAASGAAIIRYRDDKDGGVYLYTLLVPSEREPALSLFRPARPEGTLPLDAHRARRLDGDRQWSAGRAERRGHRHPRWRFAETEPISTYLAAFAAGPGRTGTPRPPATGRSTSMRVPPAAPRWMPRRRSPPPRRRPLARRLVRHPYPFAKLDLVLAPAFPFGGMEHVGAVFYNEDRSSFASRRRCRSASTAMRPSITRSAPMVRRRCDDAWFDDLWLKEGFSTYMAARIQAELQPDSNAWTTFLLSTKTPAYRADATSGTQALWQPLDNLDRPRAITARSSTTRRRPSSNSSPSGRRGRLPPRPARFPARPRLWQRHLAGSTRRDRQGLGVDLGAFGRQYMLRAGLPRIDTRLTPAGDRIGTLALVQRPARALPGDPGGAWR